MSEPLPIDIEQVLEFARRAHGSQKRKYTGEPYIVHPIEVAELVASVTSDAQIIAAAYLHDVVDDTPVTLDEIHAIYGGRVTTLVWEVTDISGPHNGNRAKRKAVDRDHLANASAEGQTIKLADLISNTRSIVRHDPDFAKVYIPEKRALLAVLTKGDWRLVEKAYREVEAAEAILANAA